MTLRHAAMLVANSYMISPWKPARIATAPVGPDSGEHYL